MEQPRRTLLGLVAMTATLALLNLFSSGQTLPDQAALDLALLKSQISGTVELFIAVVIGSVIARGKFLIPAISFFLIIQLISIYTLYQIALPTGQANLFDIVLFSAPFFAISLLVAGLAAWIGAWYYEREFGNVTAATWQCAALAAPASITLLASAGIEPYASFKLAQTPGGQEKQGAHRPNNRLS